MGKLFILANIDEAIRLVTEQPEKMFDLSSFAQKTDCGTIYCTAGLLATSAHFRALGWRLQVAEDGAIPCILGLPALCSAYLPEQFGPAAADLFYMRSYCEGFLGDDKALALHRLNQQRQLVENL